MGKAEHKLLLNGVQVPENWPKDMSDAAFHGPMGDLVRLIEPNTEADPHGLLLDLLVSFGNAVGTGAYFQVEADHHHTNLFAALVGQSATARKGTTLGHTDAVRGQLDEHWAKHRVQAGLSSSEGLIAAVEAVQNGSGDCRFLVIEDEFASVFKVMSRHGNTLGTTVRRAWDGRPLQTMTKAEPQLVTGAHISIIAHTTAADLGRYLANVDMLNGFANRVLWCCVRRRRLLPFGGQVPQDQFRRTMKALPDALLFAKQAGEIGISTPARSLWIAEYPDLTAEIPGLLGSVISRGDALVRRLAAIYALLDKSQIVRSPHLKAALEVWRYCRDSAEYLFRGRDSRKPPKIVEIKMQVIELLRESPKGMTRTELSGAFNNHQDASALNFALSQLQQEGWVNSRKEKTRGRAAERWFAITKKEKQ